MWCCRRLPRSLPPAATFSTMMADASRSPLQILTGPVFCSSVLRPSHIRVLSQKIHRPSWASASILPFSSGHRCTHTLAFPYWETKYHLHWPSTPPAFSLIPCSLQTLAWSTSPLQSGTTGLKPFLVALSPDHSQFKTTGPYSRSFQGKGNST